MTMTLVNLPETTICGLSAPFDETLYPTREALRHALWADTCEDVPGESAARGTKRAARPWTACGTGCGAAAAI